MIDEDAPHRDGRCFEEVQLALLAHLLGVDQSQECLMNQRGRLEGMATPFALHQAVRHLAQLGVQEVHELGARAVPRTDLAQDLIEVVLRHVDVPTLLRNLP